MLFYLQDLEWWLANGTLKNKHWKWMSYLHNIVKEYKLVTWVGSHQQCCNIYFLKQTACPRLQMDKFYHLLNSPTYTNLAKIPLELGSQVLLFLRSRLTATICFKFEVCCSTGLGDMSQNMCFGVARTTFPSPKKGRSAKTGQKIKKNLTVTPLKIKFWF